MMRRKCEENVVIIHEISQEIGELGAGGEVMRDMIDAHVICCR